MHRLTHRHSGCVNENLKHLLWDLTAFEWRGDQGNSIRPKKGKSSYPVRHLRYWFMDHLLAKEYVSRQGPLAICEVGVGEGQLLQFIHRGCTPTLPQIATIWDAVSLRMDKSRLSALGYGRLLEKDIEQSDLILPQQYDVLILLHVLEHLHEPEKALTRVLPFLKNGGLIIGGVPVIPHSFCRLRERQLRKTAELFGHVSAFSPRRVKEIAKDNRLRIEMLTGAYFMRWTGSFLEQHRWWVRFNLLWGALVPAWPGELYFAIRNENASPSHSHASRHWRVRRA